MNHLRRTDAMAAIVEQRQDSVAGLIKLGRRMFPESDYQFVRGVAVFREHKTETEDGKPRNYDRAYLQAIVDRCNRRIAETGDFAALVDGHTPEKEGIAQPESIGFVGPFWLGELGIAKKCVAIFACEWRSKDRLDRLKRLPRRSVELWDDDNPRNVFIDPVAAISETPRLDLGVQRFGMHPVTGKKAIRYSAASVPATPAGSNTSLPKLGTKPDDSRKRKHSMAAGSEIEEIVRAAIEGITNTPVWKGMEALVAERNGKTADPADGADLPGGEEPPMEGEEPEGDDPADLPGGDEDEDEDLIDPDGEGTPAAGMDAGAGPIGDDEDEPPLKAGAKRYGADADAESLDPSELDDEPNPASDPRMDRQPTEETYSVTRRYSKLAKYAKHQTQVIKGQAEMIQDLYDRLGAVTRHQEDMEREAILDDLHAQKYAFDLGRKKKKCLYSMGSRLDSDQFLAECEEIKAGGKTVVGRALPTNVAKYSRSHEAELDEAELHQLAADHCNNEIKAGRKANYAKALNDVRAARISSRRGK